MFAYAYTHTHSTGYHISNNGTIRYDFIFLNAYYYSRAVTILCSGKIIIIVRKIKHVLDWPLFQYPAVRLQKLSRASLTLCVRANLCSAVPILASHWGWQLQPGAHQSQTSAAHCSLHSPQPPLTGSSPTPHPAERDQSHAHCPTSAQILALKARCLTIIRDFGGFCHSTCPKRQKRGTSKNKHGAFVNVACAKMVLQ